MELQDSHVPENQLHYSLETWSEEIITFLETVVVPKHKKTYLVGNSVGGLVCATVAYRKPEVQPYSLILITCSKLQKHLSGTLPQFPFCSASYVDVGAVSPRSGAAECSSVLDSACAKFRIGTRQVGACASPKVADGHHQQSLVQQAVHP